MAQEQEPEARWGRCSVGQFGCQEKCTHSHRQPRWRKFLLNFSSRFLFSRLPSALPCALLLSERFSRYLLMRSEAGRVSQCRGLLTHFPQAPKCSPLPLRFHPLQSPWRQLPARLGGSRHRRRLVKFNTATGSHNSSADFLRFSWG